MAFGRKTGGRQKGTPNKVSRSMREAIWTTFVALGDAEGLKTWASDPKNLSLFYSSLCGRLVPTSLQGSDDPDAEPIKHVIEHVYQEKP